MAGAQPKTPANTPTTYYLDTPTVKEKCRDDFAKIDAACKPDSEKPDKGKTPNLRKIVKPKVMKKIDEFTEKVKSHTSKTSKTSYKDSAENAWMSHCDGLWIKPDNKTFKNELAEFNEMLKSLSDDLDSAITKLVEPLVEELKQQAKDKAKDIAKDKAVKLGARSGVRWGVGLAGAAVGGAGVVPAEIVMTAVNAVDAIATGVSAGALAVETVFTVAEASEILDIFNKAKSELGGLIDQNSQDSPTQMMSTAMSVLARLNDCTRARRCLLVKFSKTGTAASMGGEGCCPGQTGHHVIPDEMAKNGCTSYSRSTAPTVCVEGTTSGNGTHKKIHDNYEERIKDHRKGGFFSAGSNTIDYKQASKYGVKSIQETFPESKCDPNCLQAQLDAYYGDKCKVEMPAVSGASGAERAPAPDSGSDNDDNIGVK